MDILSVLSANTKKVFNARKEHSLSIGPIHMHKIEVKPLSVNEAWQGRRFKTSAYKNYIRSVGYLLPKIKLPEPPFEVHYEFGFSSHGSDLGNPEKMLTDILAKRYGFNDNQIGRMVMVKVVVKKGQEYIKFKIEHYEIPY